METIINIHKKLGEFSLDVELRSMTDRIGILGASGCGKSMTLKSIAGIEKPDSGFISIGGKVLFDSEKKINLKPQVRNIGYLFQNYALFPTMTVEQNISAGLKCAKEEKDSKVAEMIETFRLTGLEKRLPGQLSGGQQQRVALARIMAYEPDAILLDEPFSALDVFLKDRLQQELFEMLEAYKGLVIMVSHSRDEVYRFSNELMVMDHGRNVISGPTKDIFVNPQKLAAARLTGCKNFSKAVVKDAHTIYAADWDCELHMENEIPQDTNYIGYRANYFVPIWGEKKENCIKAEIISSARFPFQTQYFIRPQGDETAEEICWYVNSRISEGYTDNLPDYLQLQEEYVHLLTE